MHHLGSIVGAAGMAVVAPEQAARPHVLSTAFAHSGAVTAVAFSPDGSTLATGTADGFVRLWDAGSGLFLRALRVGGASLAFSPDGSVLACGGADASVTRLDWRRALEARSKAVDLIPEFERLGLTPRGQGARPTCSVFTTVEALEWAVARRTGEPVRLSVEFLNWAGHQVTGEPNGDGHFFHNALEGYRLHGICRQDEMPYREKVDPSQPPSPDAMATAATYRDMDLRVHWIKPYGTPQGLTDEEFAQTKATLDAGYPVAAGADHSVLFVGYLDDPAEPGGGAFLVLDSGGPGHYREKTYAEALATQNDLFWVE